MNHVFTFVPLALAAALTGLAQLARLLILVLALGAICGCVCDDCQVAADAAPNDWRTSVALEAGQRRYKNAGEFPGIDEPPVYGLQADTYRPDDLLGYELGLSFTEDSADQPAGRFEADVTELTLGLRKTFPSFPIQPYVGAGVALTSTNKDYPVPGDDDDFDSGLYLRLGARWYAHESLFLGVDYRLMREEFAEYGGFDVEYDQVAFQIGLTL